MPVRVLAKIVCAILLGGVVAKIMWRPMERRVVAMIVCAIVFVRVVSMIVCASMSVSVTAFTAAFPLSVRTDRDRVWLLRQLLVDSWSNRGWTHSSRLDFWAFDG